MSQLSSIGSFARALTLLLIHRLVGGARGVTSLWVNSKLAKSSHDAQSTYQHLLVLADPDSLPLHNLQVLQTAQHLVVHLEHDLDAERGALLDGERLVLEVVERAGRRQLNHHVRPSLDFQSQTLDDAFPRVIGVTDGGAGGQAQRGLPSVQSFVVLIYSTCSLAVVSGFPCQLEVLGRCLCGVQVRGQEWEASKQATPQHRSPRRRCRLECPRTGRVHDTSQCMNTNTRARRGIHILTYQVVDIPQWSSSRPP